MPFPFTPEQKQTAFWLGLGGAFLLLLYALGPVLTPFIAAAMLAYALNGGDKEQQHHQRRIGPLAVPRALAVALVMLLFLSAVTALVLIVVPVLQTEIPLLLAQIPAFLVRIDKVLSPRLQEMGIKIKLDGSGIRAILSQQFSSSDEIWATVLASARIGGTRVLGWLATLILIPVALFYLLLDWRTR
jgi:predicted PurR-regulated permease PerM